MDHLYFYLYLKIPSFLFENNLIYLITFHMSDLIVIPSKNLPIFQVKSVEGLQIMSNICGQLVRIYFKLDLAITKHNIILVVLS